MAEVVNSASQNQSKPNVNHKHSRFPIEFNSFDTHQFGYIRPHLALLGIPSDSLKHRPIVKSRSYTLNAPLMQDVYRKLTYFKVDLDAVLPLNAEKIYTNPVIGSDVPVDANCCIENAFKKIADAVEFQISSALSAFAGTPNAAGLANVLRALVFGELFYSRGSLLASLGAHLFPQFYAYINGSSIIIDFDDYFDYFISEIISTASGQTFDVYIDGQVRVVDVDFDSSKSVNYPNVIGMREFLTLIRETSDWYIDNSADSIFNSNIFTTNYLRVYTKGNDVPFNIQRVLSYQLACAEFFSNDKVDFIYSAELYRQYIGDLINTVYTSLGASFPAFFTYNGISYQYDYLSGVYLDYLLNVATTYLFNSSPPRVACFQYFLSVFGLKRSLRYKDYFVGSRAYPLAVGDVNVQVNSNLVNVVDVARKTQFARFYNLVNHVGRRISNYVKALFDVDIKPDRHVPQWLADLTEHVYTSEVENTGVDQLTKNQSVTAIFTSNSSNKELEFGVDLQCCIIGVTTYDIERSYSASVDRDFFIKDRFDMFLPELQFVGDQAVYSHELDSSSQSPFGSAMGYQFRDQQWKLIYSRASGGFVGKLPGYAFISGFKRSLTGNVISPEFIRSFPTEFDNFFVSLTGYSLGNYWHFIVKTTNIIDANRQMIANPVILE